MTKTKPRTVTLAIEAIDAIIADLDAAAIRATDAAHASTFAATIDAAGASAAAPRSPFEMLYARHFPGDNLDRAYNAVSEARVLRQRADILRSARRAAA